MHIYEHLACIKGKNKKRNIKLKQFKLISKLSDKRKASEGSNNKKENK